MIGLYRLKYGSAIVKSFYDYEACQIGPYHLPLELYYSPEESAANYVYEYVMYKAMINNPLMLAIFNLNNNCLCCVYQEYLHQISTDGTVDPKKPLIFFDEPLNVPVLKHVGWWKTFPDNLTVTQGPHAMLANDHGIVVSDYEGQIVARDVVEDPPTRLYEKLVEQPEEVIGIMFGIDPMKPIYIGLNTDYETGTEKLYLWKGGS